MRPGPLAGIPPARFGVALLVLCMLAMVSACGRVGFKLLETAGPNDKPTPTSHRDGGAPSFDGSMPSPPDAGDGLARDGGTRPGVSDGGDSGSGCDGGGQGDACDAGNATDSDNDGTPDASDDCPLDPAKTTPGACGCGATEACQGLIDAIAHRYRFDGTGTAVVDAIGDENGTATGTALTGSGSLELPGNGAHATLPSQLLSVHGAVTIEFWMTWQGGAQDQKAIAFGTATPAPLSVLCNGGSYCSSTSTAYYGGSWYRFCTARSCNWGDANAGCRSAGAHLVSIDSLEEQQYIENHPAWLSESMWLGANDRTVEGEWYWQGNSGDQGGAHFWSGGADGSPITGRYTNWAPSEPANTSTADCAFMSPNGKQWWVWECTGYVGHAACEWHGHQSDSIDRGVWFTPFDGSGLPRLSYRASASTNSASGASAFPIGVETHVALVLDPAGDSLALYIDGAPAASVSASDALSALRDGDNWLGRSHVSGDPSLDASFSELRIYNRALSDAELATSEAAGPDPVFLEP